MPSVSVSVYGQVNDEGIKRIATVVLSESEALSQTAMTDVLRRVANGTEPAERRLRPGCKADDDSQSWSDPPFKLQAIRSLVRCITETAEIASEEVKASSSGSFGSATSIFEDLAAVLNKHDPDATLRTAK